MQQVRLKRWAKQAIATHAYRHLSSRAGMLAGPYIVYQTRAWAYSHVLPKNCMAMLMIRASRQGHT